MANGEWRMAASPVRREENPMPRGKPDVERPTLERKDLAPEAREPLTDHSIEGWGGHYSGPLTTDPDEPLLDVLDATAAPGRVENAGPRREALPEAPDPFPDEAARDFRREE
jgi:hypothetical protein